MTAAAARRALWSEDVPYAALREPAVLGALASFAIELKVAVRPWTQDELPSLLQYASGAAGIDAGLKTFGLDDLAATVAECESGHER